MNEVHCAHRGAVATGSSPAVMTDAARISSLSQLVTLCLARAPHCSPRTIATGEQLEVAAMFEPVDVSLGEAKRSHCGWMCAEP